MFAGRTLLAAARRRRPAASRRAPAAVGFQGLPDVHTLFQECDQDRDGRLLAHEAARLAQWLAACAPEAIVSEYLSATGSPQDLLLQDVEHVHAGLEKHLAGDTLPADPAGRVIILHGARPGVRALDAADPGALAAMCYGHLASEVGGMAYGWLADSRAYLDSATYWRAHFSVGQVQRADGAVLDVRYGSGTFGERGIERVDILHHAVEAMQGDFGASSPYLLPYPCKAPEAAAIYPDAWMEVAELIPAAGLMRSVGGVPVRVTRRSFIEMREHLPQEYFLALPGFLPPLRVYEMARLEMVERALQVVWPGDAGGLVLEVNEGGWRRPGEGARLDGIFRKRLRVCAASGVVELNAGEEIQKYSPGFFSRTWTMMKTL